MDFGSDYVYLYEEPCFEYISDEEYEAGMNISDSDSGDEEIEHLGVVADAMGDVLTPPAVPPPPAPPAPGEPAMLGGGGGLPLSAVPPPPPVPHRPHAAPAKKGKLLSHHWRSEAMSTESCYRRAPPGGPAPPPPPPPQVKGQRVRKGDTNIVSVKFNKLISPSNMHAGDPEACTACSAILSKISKVKLEGEEKVWACEFCSGRNIVDMEEEEIPKEEDITFMLEPALSTTASGPSGLDESLVIFCVDVSGSMCVTTEVPGHVELRGAQSLRRAQQMNRERGDQYLPRQRRDVTYVSRLQSVQAAIDHQLQQMEKEFPNRRVALVTFSNEVTVIGDGKQDPVNIAGDKLTKTAELKTMASEQPFPEPIKKCRQALGQKLFELEEGGPTALGPALLVSATMATKVRGSKVILCTDGLANIGMGKLDNFKAEKEKEQSVQFYEDISESAVENGVSISVITIKGTDCKLVEIGKMADKTGGQVNIVDPLKLTQEFSTILANKIIATNVVATFILHKQLFFFYEDTEESKIVKTIGNVTTDTEISFEYGVRTKPKEEEKQGDGKQATGDDKDAMQVDEGSAGTSQAESKSEAGSSTSTTGEAGAGTPGAGSEERTELPFQLQIVYTDTEGAKALRLITMTKPVTRDRRKAERLAKVDILAKHTAQTSADLALQGKYTMSRQRALMNQRVAWRHKMSNTSNPESKKAYKSKFGKIKSVENYLGARQQRERATTGGMTYSDDEDDACEDTVRAAPSASSGPPVRGKSKSFFSRLRKKRSETTEDAGAALVYQARNAKQFLEEDSDSD